jgi:hypothetical protein
MHLNGNTFLRLPLLEAKINENESPEKFTNSPDSWRFARPTGKKAHPPKP